MCAFQPYAVQEAPPLIRRPCSKYECCCTVWCILTQTLLETDTSDILNELIYCCRKGGIIACVGVYVGLTNGYANAVASRAVAELG